METDTQDTTGTVLSETDASGLTEEAVREAVLCFVGDYDQIPPMYSALKVNGRKLCDLARQGVEVERKPRPVKIYDITIRSIPAAGGGHDRFLLQGNVYPDPLP